MADATFGADRTLALTYIPARHRPAIEALWGMDAAMADVVRTSSQPMLGAIRLAWWRERLEELDAGAIPPAEPRLQSVAAELLLRGIAARDVAALEEGWLRLFDPFPWTLETAQAIASRGRHLFGIAAAVLGERTREIDAAGALWATVDAARHCSDAQSRNVLRDHARALAGGLQGAFFPSPVRPLSLLVALAVRDIERGEPFEAEGTPARAAVMLRHRLTGRLPPLG